MEGHLSHQHGPHDVSQENKFKAFGSCTRIVTAGIANRGTYEKMNNKCSEEMEGVKKKILRINISVNVSCLDKERCTPVTGTFKSGLTDTNI
jgi:hypothetical protein